MGKTTQLRYLRGGRNWAGEGCPCFPLCFLSLPHRPTLPTSSGSYHTLLAFPLTTGFLQLQHLPLTAVPFPGLPLHTGHHHPRPTPTSFQPLCSCLPQMAPWDLGPCCLCNLGSSALSTRPLAVMGSIYTLVKAQVFTLCNALFSLQKKKKVSVVK